MISTEWIECSKLHPSLAHFFCSVSPETTYISTNLKIFRKKLFQTRSVKMELNASVKSINWGQPMQSMQADLGQNLLLSAWQRTNLPYDSVDYCLTLYQPIKFQTAVMTIINHQSSERTLAKPGIEPATCSKVPSLP